MTSGSTLSPQSQDVAAGQAEDGYPPVSNDNSAHPHRPKVNCAPSSAPRGVAIAKAVASKVPHRHWDMKFALGMIALVIIINLSLTLLLGNNAKAPLVITGEKKTPDGSARVSEMPQTMRETLAVKLVPLPVAMETGSLPAPVAAAPELPKTAQESSAGAVPVTASASTPAAAVPELPAAPTNAAPAPTERQSSDLSPPALEPAAGAGAGHPVTPIPLSEPDRKRLLSIINQY